MNINIILSDRYNVLTPPTRVLLLRIYVANSPTGNKITLMRKNEYNSTVHKNIINLHKKMFNRP